MYDASTNFEEDMTNYHFRVRFRFPYNRVLDSEEKSIDIPLPLGRGTYVIDAVSGESLKESQWLLIKDVGNGFATEEEAAEAGRRVKNAVMWWSTRARIGVDVGYDEPHVWVTQY